jgi:exonuclease SbcC
MIESVTLRGFKSYRNRQTVRFTQGVNKISGRNASGKTTLLQAILFGLFGDVPGVNKQDLVPLSGGEVNVTVSARSPFTGVRFTVHRDGVLNKSGGFRTRKSVLKVEGEDRPYVREREIHGKLRELLGVGRNTFFNIVYAQQKEFVEILKPDRRRMDAILGLTTPTEIREQFREVRRILVDKGGIQEKPALQERIRNAEAAISESERQLHEVQARKKELSEGLDELEAELHLIDGRVEAFEGVLSGFSRLERTMAELDVLQDQRERNEMDLADLHEALGEDPERRRQELQRKRQAVETAEELLRQQLDEKLSKERMEVGGRISRLEHQIGELRELRRQGLTVCPKCGQEIDHELLEEDVRAWEVELGAERARLADLEREISSVREQLRAAQGRTREADRGVIRFVEQERRLNELKRTLEETERRGLDLSSRIRRETEGLLRRAEDELATAFTSIEDARGRMDAEIQRSRGRQRELAGEVRSRRDRIRDAENREQEIQRQREARVGTLEESRVQLENVVEYEAKIRAVDAIQNRYGEYEQQLRENTLRLLEYQTYNYFRRLTDQQAYAGCHIDRERYTLEVQPVGSNRLMQAWLTGGGHESLFALAERLALLRVMGFPHLLILDEPTDAVDSENVPQLLEYIARSSGEIGQILLVTHHGHGEEEGINLIRVRKVGGESRVSQDI